LSDPKSTDLHGQHHEPDKDADPDGSRGDVLDDLDLLVVLGLH
jgi:hypothetical protein